MSAAELARSRKWTVGTKLIGDEGSGPWVVEITAISEQLVVGKTLFTPRDGWRTEDRESVWSFDSRHWVVFNAGEWTTVPADPRSEANYVLVRLPASEVKDARPIVKINFQSVDPKYGETGDDPDLPELVVTTASGHHHYWGSVEIKETKGGWLKVSFEDTYGEIQSERYDIDDVLAITYPAKIKKHEESL